MRTNIFWSRCSTLLHWIEVPRPLLLLFVRNSSREHESSRGGYIRVALLFWLVAEAGRKGRKTKRWKHNINKNQTSYYLETVRARSGFPLNIFIQHESFRNHSEMWKVKDSLPASWTFCKDSVQKKSAKMWLFLLTCYALFASIPMISVRHNPMEVMAFPRGGAKKLPDIYWNTSNPM